MNYEVFLNSVKEELKSYLDSENKNYAVNVRKVLKNNGIELDALTIMSVECKASPTIYLSRYYEEFMEGKSIEAITEEIYELYQKNSGKMNVNIGQFADFSEIKNCIAFKVINAQKNSKLLRNVPHIKKMDLAIVFYCIIKCNEKENATTLIYNHHMNMWGVELDDIYSEAVKNTPTLLPYEIKGMSDIIKEMLGEANVPGDIHEDGCYGDEATDTLADMIMEEFTRVNGEPHMYVLTNKYRLNGAATIFYEGVLKKFADEQQKDLIILPSSIHEVILIPMENEMEPKHFKSMIREVNREEVDPSEVLSDHAYVYRRDSDEIFM